MITNYLLIAGNLSAFVIGLVTYRLEVRYLIPGVFRLLPQLTPTQLPPVFQLRMECDSNDNVRFTLLELC